MKSATWKDLVLGAFVALMLGAIVARIFAGPSVRPLAVEVDGASLAAANGGKVELDVAPAKLRLQCRGACDDLSLSFEGAPDQAAWARITDASGRAAAARHEAENGRVRIGAGGAGQAGAAR
jgi:hypothetical protein